LLFKCGDHFEPIGFFLSLALSESTCTGHIYWPKTSFTLVTIYSYNISLRKQGVCHTLALPFIWKKKYLKTKEELPKLKYSTMQTYNLQKILKKF
jgi:hypothetical protein